MLTPETPSTIHNLGRGYLHWSSKTQVRGTDMEIVRLGGNPDARPRNRERRPIYILAVLPNDSYLVLTCTSRHGTGYEGVPEDYQSSFLPIEPSCSDVKRPIIELEEDPENVFKGKTLIFLEVPVIAYAKFFTGYIGCVKKDSMDMIDKEFFDWQVGRMRASHISTRMSAAIACTYAWVNGIKVTGLAEAHASAAALLDNHSFGRRREHMNHFIQVLRAYFPNWKPEERILNDMTNGNANQRRRDSCHPNKSNKKRQPGRSRSPPRPIPRNTNAWRASPSAEFRSATNQYRSRDTSERRCRSPFRYRDMDSRPVPDDYRISDAPIIRRASRRF